MWTSKTYKEAANAHNGGAKDKVASGTSSLATTSGSSFNNKKAIVDITNGVVNIELQDKPILPKMEEAMYNTKKSQCDNNGNKNDRQSQKKSDGNNKVRKSNNSINDTGGQAAAAAAGGGSRNNKTRGACKTKKMQPDKSQQRNDRIEKGRQQQQQPNDAMSCDYDWLKRINQNKHGIQGVVFLNEFGQPVVEYLPQDGIEYILTAKVDKQNVGNNDKKMEQKQQWHPLPPEAMCHPSFQQQLYYVDQPVFGSQVLSGYAVPEAANVTQAGVVGNHAQYGYFAYNMYDTQPLLYQQQGYPMHMMMPHGHHHPSNSTGNGDPPHGMYAGANYFQYVHHPSQQAAQAGVESDNGEQEEMQYPEILIPDLDAVGDDVDQAYFDVEEGLVRQVSLESKPQARDAPPLHADANEISPVPRR